MMFRELRAPYLASALVLLAGCTTKARPTEQKANDSRQACAFTAGQLADDTLPATMPTGKDLPIEHIVLIMQENRSFDHYYSELNIPGLEVAPRTNFNLDSKGNSIQRFHFDTKCMYGGDHSWEAQHGYLDGGLNDNFVKLNGDSTTPMGYYDETDLPYYYALARTFAISDHYFCSVLGPTWPNRMFYFAGTSWGMIDNHFPPPYDAQMNPYPNLFTVLSDAKVSWNVYYQDRPTPLIVALNSYLNEGEKFLAQKDFATDVANGKLASVTVVEASDLLGVLSPDEGPPGDVDIGQQFTSGTIGAVMNSQFWKTSVIFLVYDENGGMYDHVVPPKACAPDDIKANNGVTEGFDQLGFRVPFFVISPYAKRGYVSHQVADHTSILRFVEAKFNLPAMTRRDANAAPPYDMFDFQHPDFSVPQLPTVTVDQAALAKCM